MHRMHGLKCLRCPYYLGQIKCVTDPCIECVRENRMKHPFGTLPETARCPVCGGALDVRGTCPKCKVML